MDWDQYYEKFYDWTTSTQISRMSSLTSYGASSEVAEVAQEYMDEKAASRLIKKAVAYGVQFTPEEIYDLSGCCNTEAMNVLLDSSKCRFTKEQLEDLYGAVDDEVLGRVAARNKIRLFEDDEDEEIENETGEEEFFDEPVASAPKIGFFAKLFAGIGIADALSSSHASHPGHCTGDCANCPPHYGYRYGRWYYGHGHVHGCEFGGNKGDGSLQQSNTYWAIRKSLKRNQKEHLRLYYSFNKHCSRIDNCNQLALSLGILDCLARPAGSAVPYSNDKVCLIYHVAVPLVHTVRGVVMLDQCLLVTLRGNLKITISLFLSPLLSLTFTWNCAFKSNAFIA